VNASISYVPIAAQLERSLGAIKPSPLPYSEVSLEGKMVANSDVHFLVTFDKDVSVLDWLLLNEELEQFLNAPVDVVSMRGLKPRDSQIREEAVLL